jgi:LuxR family transcriptional regulator, maltose regulon positive regulatory protein
VGAGKTTLLAEWHAAPEGERPFAWFSLDRRDNDPVRFLEGVIAALRTVEPRIGEQALVELAGPASLTDVVLPALVNDVAALSRQLVLVLDDYHVIATPRIHAAVTFLLDPPAGHAPAVRGHTLGAAAALGRLRMREELVEVCASDLRFTDDGAAALLNGALGYELDAADIARLQDRTEGWAA